MHHHACLSCGNKVPCYGIWKVRKGIHTTCDEWRDHETHLCDPCERVGATAAHREPPNPWADEGQSDARELARERWER